MRSGRAWVPRPTRVTRPTYLWQQAIRTDPFASTQPTQRRNEPARNGTVRQLGLKDLNAQLLHRLKSTHPKRTQSTGESESNLLISCTLAALQNWHLQAKCALRSSQRVGKKAALHHGRRSPNLTPAPSCPVITVVSSSNRAKSRAFANAKIMFTDSNSCTRCTRISTPDVR